MQREHLDEIATVYLIITTEGIQMDPAQADAILSWQTPKNLQDVQGFLGFVDFYRRFIFEFSKLARLLPEVRKEDKNFCWTEECQRAFDDLKHRFCTAPVLVHFPLRDHTCVETDCSDCVVAGVLSQTHDGVLRPVAFSSKKMTP